jgi:hypothetical protein
MGLFDTLKSSTAAKSSEKFPATVKGRSEFQQPAKRGMANTSSRRILFVGGEAVWLAQIGRELAFEQPTWQHAKAADWNQAVEKWAASSFDTLVLDGKIAEGARLLKALQKELAHSICVVRCQTLDRNTSAQWKGSGASLVAEETDGAALISTIKRSARILDWMGDKAIKEIISQIRKLPAQPKLHTQVTNELQSASGSMDIVGKLISQEPVMAAKILQVVNSAFFGLGREISDTTESVMVLGAERIKALILLAGVFSQYSNTKCPGFAPEAVWTHSIQVAAFSRAIALAETKNAQPLHHLLKSKQN